MNRVNACSSIGSRLSQSATKRESDLRQDGRRRCVIGVERRGWRAFQRPDRRLPWRCSCIGIGLMFPRQARCSSRRASIPAKNPALPVALRVRLTSAEGRPSARVRSCRAGWVRLKSSAVVTKVMRPVRIKRPPLSPGTAGAVRREWDIQPAGWRRSAGPVRAATAVAPAARWPGPGPR